MTSKNGKVGIIELVGTHEKVSWSQKADALIINAAKSYPSEHAVSYKITFEK